MMALIEDIDTLLTAIEGSLLEHNEPGTALEDLVRRIRDQLAEYEAPAQEAVAFEAVDLTSVASAVTEAYKPEGQAIWWRNWATADDEKRQRMESGVLGAWSGEPVLPAQEAVEQGEVSMLVKAVGDVLEEHDHADTCGMMLSPGEDYPCSCWQADLWAALIRSTTGPAPAAQEAVAVTDEQVERAARAIAGDAWAFASVRENSIRDARKALTAALARPAQAAPADRAVEDVARAYLNCWGGGIPAYWRDLFRAALDGKSVDLSDAPGQFEASADRAVEGS